MCENVPNMTSPWARVGASLPDVEPYVPFNINPTGMQPVLTTTYLMALPSLVAKYGFSVGLPFTWSWFNLVPLIQLLVVFVHYVSALLCTDNCNWQNHAEKCTIMVQLGMSWIHWLHHAMTSVLSVIPGLVMVWVVVYTASLSMAVSGINWEICWTHLLQAHSHGIITPSMLCSYLSSTSWTL